MATLTSLLAPLLLLSTLSLTVSGQQCAGMNCSSCIAMIGCQWCAAVNFVGERCATNHTSSSCNDIDIEASTGTTPMPTASDSLNPVSVTNVDLTLGVGVPQSFRIRVTPLRNRPLDLYVLIDLSASMREELDGLKSVAGQISDGISSITNNVRIGFGSFNDKVARPYTYHYTPEPPSSCRADDQDCQPNYAFRHQISLTSNITFYNEAIQGVSTTKNADRPENGLEGLAQVIACEDIIGWRDRNAVGEEQGNIRVVLFMTDDAFHYAGEGQFAGILKPYEGECLLDPPVEGQSTVEFTRWRDVDYPSVGQITQMLEENEVAIIFAIEPTRFQTYTNLAALIQSRFRASVARFESETNNDQSGANILRLIEEEVTRILQEVTLSPGESDDLSIEIRANCPADTTVEGTNGCGDVPFDTPVEFEVTVTLQSCNNFNTTDVTRTHRIISRSFGGFNITYRGDCTCGCAASASTENVNRCSNNGRFVCGVCECDEGWCGEACELLVNGSCNCGQDLTDNCPRDANGTLCYGQGMCCNGECLCNRDANGDPYRGDGGIENCACRPFHQVCTVETTDGCSLSCVNGTCGCDGCVCENRFFGSVCQSRDINTCSDEMDLTCLTRCINSGFDEDECRNCERAPCEPTNCESTPCGPTRPILTFESDGNEVPNSLLLNQANEKLPVDGGYTYVRDCETPTIGACVYDYYLLRGPEMYVIMLDTNIDGNCNAASALTLPFPVYVLVFIVIAALLVLGVVLFVLIKIIIAILDYMEVKKWERETKEADFSKNQNPLYQSPEMKYENVAYGRE